MNRASQTQSATTSALNIYNWADCIDPALLDEFEREYDTKVN